MASQENRTDANKAMYYKIQHELLEEEKNNAGAPSNQENREMIQEADKILKMSDRLLSLERMKDKLGDKDLQALEKHQRNQLFSDTVKTNFNAKELSAMMFRSKIKEKIFQEKLETHVELIRRKLDFNVIRDNHQNKCTQQILDRFTDLRQGMPGTNYKYIKL